MTKQYETVLVNSTCDNCGGKAVVPKGHISKFKVKECSVCKGTGEVQKKQIIEVK